MIKSAKKVEEIKLWENFMIQLRSMNLWILVRYFYYIATVNYAVVCIAALSFLSIHYILTFYPTLGQCLYRLGQSLCSSVGMLCTVILPTSEFAGALKNPVQQTIIAELKLLQSSRIVPVWLLITDTKCRGLVPQTVIQSCIVIVL